MKILLLDIEHAPHLVHAWGLFDQRIGTNQIIEPGYMLSWAAKWLGSREVMFGSRKKEPKRFIRRLHMLLDEADVVVHYNGIRFDIPHINREFLLAELHPPSPYIQLDLLRTVRRQFKFASNKLDFVCRQLKLGAKYKHPGHELWVACMQGDMAAWTEMEKYNKHDVVLLERLYKYLRPWVPNHPNNCSFTEPGVPVCPTCGSGRLQKRGFQRTVANKYVRYQCNDCGSWSREPFTSTTREERGVRMRAVTA